MYYINLFITMYYCIIIYSMIASLITRQPKIFIFFFSQMPCRSYFRLHIDLCISRNTSMEFGMINSLSLSLIARTHYESIMHPQRVCTRVKCVKYSAKLMAKFKSPEAFCGRSKWEIKDTRISLRDSVRRT